MKRPIPSSEVDHIDSVRRAMIARRNECFKSWPEGINDTVLFSHVIAWLSYAEALHQYVEEKEGKP